MSLLSTADLSQVLSAVALLNAGSGMETLPDRSLNCVSLLFPSSSMTAFDGFDIDGGEYTGSQWYSPSGTVSADKVQVLAELVHEHPCIAKLLATEGVSTYRTSDYLPLPRFHRTQLYNEFYRVFDGDAQMSSGMRVSPTFLATCAIHRPKVDFSDREVEMFRLLTPHLRAAFMNALAFSRVDRIRRMLSSAEKGVAVLNACGEVLFKDAVVDELVGKYFDEIEPNGLPTRLMELLTSLNAAHGGESYYTPPDPYRIRKERGELRVQIAFDEREHEISIILEEKKNTTPTDLKALGVTDREAEILHWISLGKTDNDIAAICSIKPRTVQKHAENIFVKLGVETRTAAARIAIEMPSL